MFVFFWEGVMVVGIIDFDYCDGFGEDVWISCVEFDYLLVVCV